MFYDTGYVHEIMDVIFEEVFPNPTPYTEALLEIPVPEPLTSQYEKPDKEAVIGSLVSSFKRGAVKTNVVAFLMRKLRADAQDHTSWNNPDSASQHQLANER